MMIFQQSEAMAARRRIPFVCVDATDHTTPETGLSFSAGDLKVGKNGAAEANHAGSVTEYGGGLYYYEFTSGEVDTIGFVTFRLNKTGVDGSVFVAQVINQPINGNLNCDVQAINGLTVPADKLAIAMSTEVTGAVDTGTFTPTNGSGALVFEASSITEQTTDHYKGRSIIFTSGAMTDQAVTITGYQWSVNSKAKFTCSQATETPANTDSFIIV